MPWPMHQRGVALIDVLIALVVIEVGLCALLHLQGVIVVSGVDARARSIAMLLAREKIDDLRQYAQLPAGPNGVYGFDEIGTDRGGAEAADGSLLVPAGSVALSGFVFDRHWQTAPLSWCELGAGPSPGVCTDRSRPDLIELSVQLQWGASGAGRQQLELRTAIPVSDPPLSSLALIRGPSLLPPR